MSQISGLEKRATGNGTSGRRTLPAVNGLRGRFGTIVRFALAFELLRWLILAPICAAMLRLSLERWGRCSVGDFEIIAFLLSPPGMAGLLAVGSIGLTIFYLEIAGLMLLLADAHAPWWHAFPAIGKRIVPLLGLGLRQLIILMALAAPFLGAIGVALKVLWADRDLNGLLVLKPPVFWVGLAVSVCLGGIGTLIGGYLLLRWSLALPAVLFEPGPRGGRAMRLSAQRTRGRLASVLGSVVVWLAIVVLLSGVLMGGVRVGSGWLLDHAGPSLAVALLLTAVVLILHALTDALLSVFSSAGLASLLLVLYRRMAGAPLPHQAAFGPKPGRLVRLPARWWFVGATAVVAGTVGLACYFMLARVRLEEPLEITAHRGGAAAAPENTLAAIRKAIEAGADWAEIDVQRTSDGAVVVLHDSDLDRVGGVRQRVADSTLAQIQAVDIGSRFSGEYRGERVPTLDQLIAAAGQEIRLNIELKPNGKNDVVPLVQVVVDSIKRAGIVNRCRLCSQSYEGLQMARKMEPGLQVGFIAGGQLGDLSGLDVDFLMVAERLATRKLAEAAGIRGIEVHAWTINDPDLLVPLLDRSVANIITDDPAAMRHRLEEVRALSPAERLLLRARSLLAE